MLRVFYSNQTERLLFSLVYNIQVHRNQTSADLFEPTHLIVPNKNIETYIKLGMARLTGVAANIQVGFLRSLIDDLAGKAAGGDKPVLDKTLLTDRILTALLDDELLHQPELEPVQDYLLAAGENRDAVDLRRFQLARELARLFDEYSVSRADLLEIWKDEPAIHDPEYRKTELWQRHLWRSLFDKNAWTTPADILLSADPKTLGLPKQIHIFGVSYMARAFLEILGHLAQSADLNVYTLNPCLEVWDQGMEPAAETKKGIRYERRASELGPREVYILEDPYRLEGSTEMPALALWSRPGRENLRLLNALTGCELIARIEDPTRDRDKPTLLGQLQRDISTREPERETISNDFDFTEDESLVFLSCPGIRREIEIIGAEIWSLINKDEAQRTDEKEPLRFNDIAVILPPSQAEAYQSLIGTVFGEMHRIPHNIVDLPIGGESRIAEAMELLLALPLGKFTRQDLLRLATHPSVMARFPEANPGDWLGWCDALGIVHGADRRDHEDTYINKDVFNWDQGLKRLALGAFMSGERSGDRRIFEDDALQYLPQEVPTDQMASAAQFGLLIRSLIEDARAARRDRRNLSSWMEYITALFTAYLIPQNDEDERVLRNALRQVNDISDMTLDGKKLHYRIPFELARSELAGLSGSVGQYLVDGVAVSTFLPMRAIPFRILFIAGLGEKQFPTEERKNLLDLRQARRRAGDVSPREQDNYMFLETLLSVRDKLYISHVGRDELTGDPLEPSSVVLELRHMLERGYVPKDFLEKKLEDRTYRLRRYDDAHTRQASPAAEREHNVRALGNNLRKYLKRSGTTPDLRELRQKLPEPVWEQLAEALGVFEPPQAEKTEDSGLETLTVSISAIRGFLECPLQGSAKFLLHMRDDDEEDVLTREDETFETSRFHRSVVLKKVFMSALGSGKELTDASLAAAYDDVETYHQLKGDFPTGIFAESEREEHLQILGNWREALAHVTDGKPAAPKVFRFGPAREFADAVDEVFAPVVLEVEIPTETESKKRHIEIIGTTDPTLESPSATLVPLTTTKNPKHALRGFLNHVLLSGAGRSPDGEHAICLLERDATKPERFTYSPFTQEEACDYLATILRDMLSRVHGYLLPCEAFIKLSKKKGVYLDRLNLPNELNKLHDSVDHTSSQYGPIKNPELCYEPPSEEEALEIIHRRFDPLFDKQLREDT